MFNLIDMIIVRPIVNILFVTYNFVGDFGLAIIIFTIIVKLLTWPLMKKQLHQTRLMREIQPELTEIKKNCKGNKQLESIQMMDLYKRKNIKPFRSILTLFIQLPIFIALFTAINVTVMPTTQELSGREYNVEHSAYSFVEPLDKVHEVIDLQNKYFDQLKNDKDNASYEFEPKLFGVVDLSVRPGFNNISQIIIMVFALASAALQFIIARQNDPSRQKNGKRKTMKDLMKEAADGKEASQEEINAVAQGQMTFMMPLMMLFIMINLPGAVVFYYMLTNIITAVQQKIILSRNYTEMEAAADKKVLSELRKDQKIIEAQEAEIVEKDAEIAKKEAQITRIKSTSHFKNKKHKNKEDKNVHITRISASNKKKRR